MQRWMYRGKSFVVTLRTYVVGHVTKRAQRVEEDKENPCQPFVQLFSVYIQHTTHTHTHTHTPRALLLMLHSLINDDFRFLRWLCLVLLLFHTYRARARDANGTYKRCMYTTTCKYTRKLTKQTNLSTRLSHPLNLNRTLPRTRARLF